MSIDPKAHYSKSHEWVRKEGDLLVYGISDHAQEELSNIVYVELPEVGAAFSAGDIVGTVESVKAASDLILPVSGTISAVNEDLAGAPDVLNTDPYGAGWIAKVQATNASDWDALMTAADYEKFLGE
ncbi:MAG: glycine cleavage system protein GcvH [Anaerolineaceae bacterium]